MIIGGGKMLSYATSMLLSPYPVLLKNSWNRGYGADAILATLNHFFSQNHIKRVHLKTLNWNIRAQKCFQKCGFAPCGQITYGCYTFILMETQRPTKLKGK